jgi:hypothetical protein
VAVGWVQALQVHAHGLKSALAVVTADFSCCSMRHAIMAGALIAFHAQLWRYQTAALHILLDLNTSFGYREKK